MFQLPHRPYVVTLLMTAVMLAAPARAQDLRAPLFDETDRALAEARAAQLDLLAPRTYGRALSAYTDADSAFRRGRDLSGIESDLREARLLLVEATRLAGISKVTLASALKTREAARTADASGLATSLWKDAESTFERAAREVERGDTRDAARLGKQAEEEYRDAELAAIKKSLLEEARRLVKQVDKDRADRYAPVTAESAGQLLTDAERELEQNRYDSDRARDLAQQAKYQAEHALYLAARIRQARDDRNGLEKLILELEQPLIAIASSVDLPPGLQNGPDATTRRIIAAIQALQESNRNLTQDLADAKALEEEMRGTLGGLTEERSAMQSKLEAQNELRRQVEAVDATFAPDEALVFRQGNDIIVRLIGLSFPVGSATIEPQNFALLTKVQNAIRIFPGSSLLIEGHTDSFGSDATNLTLSEERANAVREYLIANMGLDPTSIQALGYGETRPIANNETPDGRARNRRIDVVIGRPAQ